MFDTALMVMEGMEPVPRHISELTPEELESAVFLCPYCGTRVYPHFTREGWADYFAAHGSDPHKENCDYYRKRKAKSIPHLDQTGNTVTPEELLEKMLKEPKHSTRKRRQGENPVAELLDEQIVEKQQDLPVERESSIPKNVYDCYTIWGSPDAKEYSGRPVQNLIVNARTIHYHRAHTLDGVALVVGERCRVPFGLFQEVRPHRGKGPNVVLKAPYPRGDGEKEIYYLLEFESEEEADRVVEVIKDKTVKKFLVFANWKLQRSTDEYVVYQCNLGRYSKRVFHSLRPKEDLDKEE